MARKPPRLQPPYKGVTNATPYVDTPEQFTRPEGELNVRPYTGPDDTPQFGTRPVISRVFPQQFGKTGARRVQGIGVISRASTVASFVAGVGTTLTPDNARPRLSGLASLNLGVVPTNSHALREAFLVDGSGALLRIRRDGAPASQTIAAIAYTGGALTPSWVAMHPSGTLAVAAFNFTESSQHRCALVFIDPGDYANHIGCKLIAPAGESTSSVDNVDALAFTWTAEALWIARGTSLWNVPTPVIAGKARLINPTQINALAATPDTATTLPAVGKITALSSYTLSSRTYLWGAFEGTQDAGTHANPAGSITAGGYGRHFRAGLFHAEQLADVADYTYRLQTLALDDSAPLTTDAYVEVDGSGSPIAHHSARFSAWLDRAPRGCLPTALAADPVDGSAYVAFTNQGYGPNSGFPPNATIPYTTLAKFSRTGNLEWEADCSSGIGGEQGGKLTGIGTRYQTDIPDEDGANAGKTDKDGPAIRALAIDGFGQLYAAGRINSGRHNVFCLATGTGQLRWRQRTESNNPTNGLPAWATPGQADHGTPKNGLAIDASDSQLLVVGYRNNTHGPEDNTGTLRNQALMWKLNATDGTFVWWFSPTNDDAESQPAGLCAAAGVAVYASSSFTDV